MKHRYPQEGLSYPRKQAYKPSPFDFAKALFELSHCREYIEEEHAGGIMPYEEYKSLIDHLDNCQCPKKTEKE